MRVNSLYVFGLDISDHRNESEEDLLEAVFRYALREIGLDPRPTWSNRQLRDMPRSRPLALAHISTSKREEVYVLWTQGLHLVADGQLARGTWDVHPYYQGERLRAADRLVFILDELAELEEMRLLTRVKNGKSEEIGLEKALRLFWAAQSAETRRRRRATA